ncbi:MAG: 5'/3'-nucleotidase SurE, partial [Pseudomonadota bacterium]
MRVLISNDDGYRAPGIISLAQAINDMPMVSHVDVVAPDRDCSGASSSLTLLNPIRTHEMANGFISVHGTPTDCVHIGVSGLLETAPDVVVSGINAGANLGDDAIYSGTIAAAIEGRFLGLPAMAMSLAGGATLTHYDTAARVAQTLLEKLTPEFLPENTIL